MDIQEIINGVLQKPYVRRRGDEMTGPLGIIGSIDETQFIVRGNPGDQDSDMAQFIADGSSARVVFLNYANSGAAGYDVKRARGSEASPTPVTSNLKLGNFKFWGEDGNGFQFTSSYSIQASRNFSPTDWGTGHIWDGIRNNSITLEEFLRWQNAKMTYNIDQADMDFIIHGQAAANLLYTNGGTGRVGVLTNNPAYELDVVGDINNNGVYRAGGTAGVSGSFTTADARAVTITAGIVTSII